MLSKALDLKKRVIPILIGKVDMEGTGLDNLKSLPSQGRSVSDFRNQDEAYADIVAEIKRLLPQGNKTEEPVEDLNPSDISPKQIRELIGQAKLREALDLLQKAMPDESDVILLKGRLSELERSERMNIIDRREANITRNQITAAALEMINDLPDNRKKTMK